MTKTEARHRIAEVANRTGFSTPTLRYYEEIADLADAWARDECAPVKHRLRGLVAQKLDAVDARLAELLALQAERRTAALALESAPLDGPCGESCGCYAKARSTPAHTPLKTKRVRTRRPA